MSSPTPAGAAPRDEARGYTAERQFPDEQAEHLAPSALLPCPFCEGPAMPAKLLRDGYANCPADPDAFAHTMRCISCAAEGGWAKSAAGALRLWNMRDPSPVAAAPRADPVISLAIARSAVEAAQEVIGQCDCIMAETSEKDPKRLWYEARDRFRAAARAPGREP